MSINDITRWAFQRMTHDQTSNSVICFRKLSCRRLWREDGVGGEPAAAALPQLPAVQLSWSQTLWKHSEKMADQPGPAPQPGQLRQETAQ